MNKRFGNTILKVLFAALLLSSSAAMAQREDEPEGGSNASIQHVTIGGSVFGGGNLAPVAGSTEVKVNQRGATVEKDVYGGGALANVGTDGNNNTTVVELLDGIINRNVYGGGLGDSIDNAYLGDTNVAALVFNKVYVYVGRLYEGESEPDGHITINGDVFGCNNINGTPKDDVFVNIYRTAHTTGDNNNQYPDGVVTLDQLDSESYEANYDQKFAINAVYGGGNRASYIPYEVESGDLHFARVYVWGCKENTVKTIYGGGNAANVGDTAADGTHRTVNTFLVIDGGRFDRIFGGGNGYSASHNHDKQYKDGEGQCTTQVTTEPCDDYNPGANIYGTATTTIYGGLYRQVFGASNQYGDLDAVSLNINRRQECDTLLIYETFGGGNEADITANLTTNLECSDYMIGTFYGGSNLADINGNVTLNVNGGNYINVFGGSKGQLENTSVTPQLEEKAANINGTVTLNLHGGNIVNAFGGNDVKGSISGLITVNMLQQGDCGLQVDTIYGGGRDAEYAPDSISGKKIVGPLVNLLHGTVGHQEGGNTIAGCVFGGGKGQTAVVKAHPRVLIGDTIPGHESYQVTVLGNVFGGGNAAAVDGIDSVYMVKSNNIVVNLFGGGNQAIADSAVVIMTAGTVDTIFGGGNLAGLGDADHDRGMAWIEVSDGFVRRGIYGGSNKEGTIVGDITVNVTGNTTVGAIGATANIHGGGYGVGTHTNGDVVVNFGNNPTTQCNLKLYGDLYGGSALGEVNTPSGNDSTILNILNGTIYGDVYGGGLGRKQEGEIPAVEAKVYGKVFVNIGQITVGGVLQGNASFSDTTAIFGCNNLNGSPQDSVFVNIYKTAHGLTYQTNAYPDIDPSITTVAQLAANSLEQTYAIPAVYGGGNLAAYTPTLTGENKPKSATVHVYGCKNNTIKEVYGGGNAANIGTTGTDGKANTFVIIDGGRINRVFGGGKGDNTVSPHVSASIFGTATTNIYAGLIDTIFGGGNMSGTIDSISLNLFHDAVSCQEEVFNQVFGGANEADLTCNLNTTVNCGVKEVGDIYGGSNLANIGRNVVLNIQGGHYKNVFGGSKGASGEGNGANINGYVELNLNGGTMVNAFGGSNVQGNIGGLITVNVLDTVNNCGLVVDTIYGGGQEAYYTPDSVSGKKIVGPVVNLLHGTVGEATSGTVTVPGCVFGGGKGAGAVVTANPKVIIGDTEHDGNQITVLGHVFGGGNAATVDGIDSVLMVKANSQVVNLFGGGNKANADSTVVIMNVAATVDTIFGGGNLAGLVGTAEVNVSAGMVQGGIYGGSNKSGNVQGDITVNVTGGQVGTSTDRANIHGGGYGHETATAGNVTVNYGAPIALSNSPTLYGDLYGGSALGNVGATGKTITVNVINGSITGDVYGGGLGSSEHSAAVNGNVQVYFGKVIEGTLYNIAVLNTYTVGTENKGGNVFGCNNLKGAPTGTVRVDFYGGTVNNIYGGGNLAACSISPTVYINNGTVGGSVFGGGLGTSAVVAGSPSVTVGTSSNDGYQAIVTHDVYGGGDMANVTGTTNVLVQKCNSKATYVYGGGNAADVTHTQVYITGGEIDTIFGGGHGDNAVGHTVAANVNGNDTISITGGTIKKAFAGSNLNGSISGRMALNIDKSAGSGECDMYIGEAYGGGNMAAGKAGTITIGCTGTWTTTGTNNHTNHNNTNNRIGYELEGIGTVYGGANQADISNSITLNINNGIVENVFGGNNISGNISGSIQVNIEKTGNCDWYVNNVYGGGNLAAYRPTSTTDNPSVNILNGTVSGNVFGGGLGTTAKVCSNTKVTVGDLTHSNYAAIVVGNVYGGGSMAMVGDDDGETPSTNNTTVLIQQANSSVAKVFGGGMEAGVTGTTAVTISGGLVTTGVYGGCDTQGNVTGNITVNVNGGTVGSQTNLNNLITADVFGGGYGWQTTTSGNVEVNINGGTLYGDVYGGSALGYVNTQNGNNTTTVNIMGGTIETYITTETAHNGSPANVYNGGNVYGGGLGTTAHPAAVYGDVIVNIGSGTLASVDPDIHEVTNLDGNATIKGNVYGCNNAAGSPQKDVTVNVFQTAHTDGTGGTPNNTVNGTAFAIANVFGGGNKADYLVGRTAKVNIYTCLNTIERTFGGGNAAATNGVRTMIQGGRFREVYGGGNGEVSAANVNGDLTLNIHGGEVGMFFVGSNQQGTITGTATVNVDSDGPCLEMNIDEFFCGGNYADFEGDIDATIACNTTLDVRNLYGGCNLADVVAGNGGSGNIHLSVYGGTFENVYGGSKGSIPPADATPEQIAAASADIEGNILLDIHGGTIDTVFGGCNVFGNVAGKIVVNLIEDGECPLVVHNVYGSGRDAFYTPTTSEAVTGNYPEVNIIHGTVSQQTISSGGTTIVSGGNVFGGGYGVTAVVNSTPKVRIGYDASMAGYLPTGYTVTEENRHAVVEGSVYGGGDLAAVSESTLVTVQKSNTSVSGDVFGGGNKADVLGSTTVSVTGGTVIQDVYGGGALADVNGTNGTATSGANTAVTQSGGTVRTLYGGGLGSSTSGNVVEAKAYGPVQVTVNGGTVTDVYGCNNINGAPTNSVRVDINNNVTRNVYGGGNLAQTTLVPAVYINNGTIGGNVFGGGNEAGVGGGNVNMINGTVVGGGVTGGTGGVFGGCNTSGNVSGNITVSVTGGTIGTNATNTANVHGGGYGYQTSASGNVNVTINGTSAVIWGDVYGGSALGNVNDAATDQTNVTLTSGTVNGNLYGGGLGSTEPNYPAAVNGAVQVTVNGGTVTDVYGCNNINGAPTSTVRVDINNDVTRNVYGGGNLAAASVSPKVYINNGTVGGSVFGGGNGDPTDATEATAMITGNPEVTIGDATAGHYSIVTGNVYGGGNAAKVTGNTIVTYNDNNTSSHVANLFGGGNAAGVTGTTEVDMILGNVTTGLYGGCNAKGNVGGNITVSVTGGTIGTDDDNTANVHGGGYGNQTSTSGNVELTINGTSVVVYGDVYGGSALGNVNDAATDQTNVTLRSGTIHGDLYGGGLGSTTPNYPAAVNGKVQVTVDGGTVTGSVYGCNNKNGAPQSTVTVDINGTDTPVSGYALANVFGGGNLAAYVGTPDVTIHNCGNSIGYVYGGGNKASVKSTNVVVYGGNTIGYVFAGGNGEGMATDFTMVSENALANIYGGTIGKVFGGNNNSGAIEGTISVNVYKQTESGHTACPMIIGEVYGGGNFAAGKAGTITVGCTGDIVSGPDGHIAKPNNIGTTLEGIGTVYGGANAADITTNITLNINDGMINRVFGGNNNSGNINGTITVNIQKTGSCWYVGDVYGGGDHAAYSGIPEVNIIAGTVYRNVFGGGNDIVDANNSAIPTIGVGGSNVEMINGTVLLGVYGGCNLRGTVTGNSLVKIYGGTVGSNDQLSATTPIVAQVFGGGLGEPTRVNGNVEVNFGTLSDTHSDSPKLYGDIYGGSALGNVNTDNHNTTVVNIHNGTIETVTSDGTTINGQHYYIYHGGNVYGGGLGEKQGVDGGTSNIEAKVNGVVFVNIGAASRSGRDLNPEEDENRGRATIKGNVYGCNNTNGSPQDSVTVHIYRTHRDATDEVTYHEDDGTHGVPTFAIPNVFGGGNKADYKPLVSGRKLKVLIHGCYNSVERVFGGSNAAAAGNSGTSVVVNTIIDGGRFDHVFGGGNGEVQAADIFGNVDLEIHGGYVDEFYVGSNQQGSISGTSNVLVDQSSGCEEIDITEFFCGGKYADFYGNIEVTIKCSDGLNVNDLYGGCKEAKVRKYPSPDTPGLSPELVEFLNNNLTLVGTGGNIHLVVQGGTYDHIYGGSKGRIGSNPANNISADIEGNVVLEVFGGTVMKAIYGGCNILGDIAGNILVNVEDGGNDGCALDVSIADVYGGGNMADYNTTSHANHDYPQVNIRNATVKNVFGGGYQAKVTGNPKIKIKKGSKILGNVYGGGNMGEVDGSPKVTIDGKDNSESPHSIE